MEQQLVFGAGLVGGFLAGVLRHSGYPVALVVRPQLRNRFENGLKLTAIEGDECLVEGFELIDGAESDALGNVKTLWLTVKCTAVEDAVKDLGKFVDKDTVIICCQNGLGSDHVVKKAFPKNKVLRAMIQFNVASMAEAHLHRSTDGDVVIERDDSSLALASQLNSQLMGVRTSDEMEAVMWAKLQLNLSNAVNGLADIPTKAMIEQRDYRRVLALLMDELLEVVSAKRLQLPKLTGLPAERLPGFLKLPQWLFRILGSAMLSIDPSARSSMWWDLKNGKKTEVQHLNGAVVREARKLGIAAPRNQAIVDLVHEVESGERTQGIAAKDLLRQLQGL